MQLPTINVKNYKLYDGHQYNRLIHFTLANKEENSFNCIFGACKCNDCLRSLVCSKWKEVKDKENFYLVAQAEKHYYTKEKIINSLKFLRVLETQLDWEESTYSDVEGYSDMILIYVNPNWVLTPYMFSLMTYVLRSCDNYNEELHKDIKDYLTNKCNLDKLYFNKYWYKIDLLLNKKFIRNVNWSETRLGFIDVSLEFDENNKKEMILKKKKIESVVKKKGTTQIKMFRPQIRSRHPSHDPLRSQLPKLPFRSIVRLGSTTIVEGGDSRATLNPIEAIKNSSSKLRMKNCFTEGKVKTAIWEKAASEAGVRTFFKTHEETGIVLKSHFGSRGEGNTLVRTKKELDTWLQAHGGSLANYLMEKFYNYAREYRLHVDKNGCFYTCRKMLKQGTPDKDKWYRNSDHCVWIMDNNPSFDKPVNWKTVITESVKALKSCGLDFGAVDLRIQSAKDSNGKKRTEPDFIVVEINSAPSFGEVTLQKYLERIPQLLKDKNNGN